MKQVKFFVAAAAACACLTAGLNQALAAFGEIDQIFVDPIQYHGITTDGTTWCLAKPWDPQWNTYDSGWNYLDNIVVGGASQIRGMSFHDASGHLVVADYGVSTVREVQMNGTVVNSFAGIASMNSVSVNNDDQTVWLASYNGTVEHRTLAGSYLGGFSTGYNWTGIAVDTVAQTLLLLDTNDAMHEYTFTGSFVGTPLPGDQIDFNGQDLHYDCTAATLWVTSVDSGVTPFESWVTVFKDPDRPTCGVPCPADVNGDAVVDVLDLLAVLAAWGATSGPEDINGDGIVDVLDLLELLAAWGPC